MFLVAFIKNLAFEVFLFRHIMPMQSRKILHFHIYSTIQPTFAYNLHTQNTSNINFNYFRSESRPVTTYFK